MRIKLIFFLFFLFFFTNFTYANIYWLYEFYNISPSFNIFSLNDNEYQKCLKENLGDKDYKKAVEYKSSVTQKMEGAADQCVQKLLTSQLNTELQLCLQNELSNTSYNNLITKQFSKSPGKNDFKAFYKCLSELKTKTVVANNEQYNKSNSCPKGYKLVNNSCQSDGSKQKSNDLKKVTENKLNIKKKKYNLNDPALNKCFKKMLGEKRYQEIIFSGSEKPNAEENTSIVGCQQNPDSMWQGSLALGYNTPDYYYDIFDGNKVKD